MIFPENFERSIMTPCFLLEARFWDHMRTSCGRQRMKKKQKKIQKKQQKKKKNKRSEGEGGGEGEGEDEGKQIRKSTQI